jgi:hypothetical protein
LTNASFIFVFSEVTKKVVLTRLVVGHTHNDVDAIFGMIWKGLRKEHIHTAAKYKDLVSRVLSGSFDVEIQDVFIVPDYEAVLGPIIDSNFGRYCKGFKLFW